jgi:hypothetical protein
MRISSYQNLSGEMVQNNQKTGLLCCFLPFWGIPKWTQKDRKRPASGQDVWPDV